MKTVYLMTNRDSILTSDEVQSWETLDSIHMIRPFWIVCASSRQLFITLGSTKLQMESTKNQQSFYNKGLSFPLRLSSPEPVGRQIVYLASFTSLDIPRCRFKNESNVNSEYRVTTHTLPLFKDVS